MAKELATATSLATCHSNLSRVVRPSQQLQELFDRQISFLENASERAGAYWLVIRHDDARERIVPAKYHVAAALTAESEADAFERLA